MPVIADRTYKSKNKRSRGDEEVKFLVLHYTAVPLNTTLGIFTNDPTLTEVDEEYFNGTGTDPKKLCSNEVSAHYVISEDKKIYQLVEESKAAFHAGVSFWNGVKNINNSSIGVEHVNIGYDWLAKFPEDRAYKVEGSDNKWCAFAEEQISATIELCQEIIERNNIKPYNVVGHSDIACGRKPDPGPAFPWKRLADVGIGMWYDCSESTLTKEEVQDKVNFMQKKLAEFGYSCENTGELDEQTINTVKAFQQHFRSSNINGEIDLESMQIIDSLCQRKANLLLAEELPKELSSKISRPKP